MPVLVECRFRVPSLTHGNVTLHFDTLDQAAFEWVVQASSVVRLLKERIEAADAATSGDESKQSSSQSVIKEAW